MTNTTDIAQDILDRYDLGQHGRGDVELKDNVVRITMCAPSWKELTAVVPADATREQILQAICLTIFQYDPDLDYHNELWANGGCNNQFFPAEALGQYRDAKQWFSAKTLSMTAELNGWDKIPAQSSETLQDAFDRIANLREEVWELRQICHRTDAEQLLRRAAKYLEEAQDAVEVTLSARKEHEWN